MTCLKLSPNLIMAMVLSSAMLSAQPPANQQQLPANRPPRKKSPTPSTPTPKDSDSPALEGSAAQESWAKQLEVPLEFTNSIGMTFRFIPPGEFQMGSETDPVTLKQLLYAEPEATADERPRHLVKMTKPYYLQITEVTQAQWVAVMGTQPWERRATQKQLGDHLPAFNISWNDAIQFCRKLSEQEEVHYRLPTEAEWEYACRAGSETLFFTGNESEKLTEHVWYILNTSEEDDPYHHQVGTQFPNPFGLYDMHGNVAEWCLDLYHKDYYQYSPGEDPVGPENSSFTPPQRVHRGGSWYHREFELRSSDRSSGEPKQRHPFRGFRVVLGEPVATEPSPDSVPEQLPGNRPPTNRRPGEQPIKEQSPGKGGLPPNRPPVKAQPPSRQPSTTPPGNPPALKRPPVKRIE